MKPAGRLPAAQFIRTVSSVVIAAILAVTVAPSQDSLDALKQDALRQAAEAEQGDASVLDAHDGEYGALLLSALLQAAEGGDALAQYNRGLMYLRGRGETKDKAEAARWFRKAADQGYAKAQYKLGFMYRNGEGVLKDASEAVRWYRKAADQGAAAAQTDLGLMYLSGRDVLKDASEAVRWFRKAAAQGDALAQSALGFIYNDGMGVTKDNVLAHMWYNIAGTKGHERSRELRDDLERDMTRAEISRATELARACMTSDYQNCQQ